MGLQAVYFSVNCTLLIHTYALKMSLNCSLFLFYKPWSKNHVKTQEMMSEGGSRYRPLWCSGWIQLEIRHRFILAVWPQSDVSVDSSECFLPTITDDFCSSLPSVISIDLLPAANISPGWGHWRFSKTDPRAVSTPSAPGELQSEMHSQLRISTELGERCILTINCISLS